MKILSKTFNLSAKHRVLLRAQSNYTGGRQRPPPKRIGSVPFSAGTLRVPAANDVALRRHLLRRTTALRAVEGQARSVKSDSGVLNSTCDRTPSALMKPWCLTSGDIA